MKPLETRLRRTSRAVVVCLALYLVMLAIMLVSWLVILLNGEWTTRMFPYGGVEPVLWRAIASVALLAVEVAALGMVTVACVRIGRPPTPFAQPVVDALRWCARLMIIAAALSIFTNFYVGMWLLGTAETHLSVVNLMGVLLMYMLANVFEMGMGLQAQANTHNERDRTIDEEKGL